MKLMKKLIIVAALMCSAMLFVACGGDVEYSVTVKDAMGNTLGKDTIVEFYDGEEKAGMQMCDDKGVAKKVLPSGTYTIKVTSTDKEVSYHFEETKVTASKKSVEIVVSNKLSDEPETLYVSGEEVNAYYIGVGANNVDLAKGKRSYFLFVPTEAGTYEFSVECESKTEIGYYGAPHFVQEFNAAELVDGKFTISVAESMIGKNNTGTTVLVIGVDSDKKTNATLCIERIGDAEKTLDDIPETVYEKTVELKEYTFPAGKTLVDFDITSTTGYKLVFNKTDGYYHLNNENGPLVVVYLAEDPKTPYLPCFKNILDRSGVNKFIKNDKDEYIEKITYDACLLEYIEYADIDTGVYPLTEDLKTIIQERGEFVGWWDPSSPGFIFKGADEKPIAGFNKDIAWLFMCAYVQ